MWNSKRRGKICFLANRPYVSLARVNYVNIEICTSFKTLLFFDFKPRTDQLPNTHVFCYRWPKTPPLLHLQNTFIPFNVQLSAAMFESERLNIPEPSSTKPRTIIEPIKLAKRDQFEPRTIHRLRRKSSILKLPIRVPNANTLTTSLYFSGKNLW